MMWRFDFGGLLLASCCFSTLFSECLQLVELLVVLFALMFPNFALSTFGCVSCALSACLYVGVCCFCILFALYCLWINVSFYDWLCIWALCFACLFG